MHIQSKDWGEFLTYLFRLCFNQWNASFILAQSKHSFLSKSMFFCGHGGNLYGDSTSNFLPSKYMLRGLSSVGLGVLAWSFRMCPNMFICSDSIFLSDNIFCISRWHDLISGRISQRDLISGRISQRWQPGCIGPALHHPEQGEFTQLAGNFFVVWHQ